MSPRIAAGRSSWVARLATVTSLSVATVLVGLGAASAAHAGPGLTARQRGLVYDGLVARSSGPCAGGYQVLTGDGSVVCSIGPEAAPPGVDASQSYDTTTAAASTSTVTGSVPCYGDGVSGSRVQLVYAVASDQADGYVTMLPTFQGVAAAMDGAVRDSAAAAGGVRHLRFVTNADCTPNVAKVVLSPTGDDTFANTMSELKAQGYTRSDRKYVVWVDISLYCGISQSWGDDSPLASNTSNTQAGYARIDRSCWNRTDHLTELHELLHTMGAVNLSAPHGQTGGHSTDEYDIMSQPNSGFATYTCPLSDEWLLDCGKDDYFNPAPAAGSYLATHWNTAFSAWMALDDLGTSATPPSSASTTPTAPTTTTVTDTFTGSVSSKKSTVRFPVTVAQGSSSSALSFSSSAKTKTVPTLRLRVLDASGAAVLSGTGPSVLSLAGSLPTGSYTWEVYGTTSISFSLAVTHLR